jgi:hypothetical protein
MEGYLHKWVNYVYGWRKRFFILHNGVLHYCRDKGKQERGAVHLKVAILITLPNDLCKFRLDTGCTVLHLKAETPEEAKTWILAIKEAKRLLSKQESDKELRESDSLFQSSARFLDIRRELTVLRSSQEQLEIMVEAMQKKVNPAEPFVRKTLQFRSQAETVVRQFSAEEQRYIKLQEEISRQTEMLMGEDEDLLSSNGSMDFKDAVSDCEEVFEVSVEKPQFAEMVEMKTYRNSLPVRRNPDQKLNIWKVIKDSIGSELSKIAVPVYFNEPLSFLQRFTEELTYSHLLREAARTQDPALRLAYVSSFAISTYSTTLSRTMKPFNPLLGETFELEYEGMQLIAEQVSHHPPVTALHCQHPDFKFYGSLQPSTAFKGTHLSVKCIGTLHVELLTTQEHFEWKKPETSVHGIIIGQINVDHHGAFTVLNTTSGAKCSVNFRKKGWFESPSHEANATVLDSNEVVKYSLRGRWSDSLEVVNADTQQSSVIWEAASMPLDYQFYYFFTSFALMLNQPPTSDLAPTDSRHRPDQRALENGDIEQASSEKYRLEEKQRISMRTREQNRQPWSPKWFRIVDGSWVYTGGYWQQKAEGFTEDPDIF